MINTTCNVITVFVNVISVRVFIKKSQCCEWAVKVEI